MNDFFLNPQNLLDVEVVHVTTKQRLAALKMKCTKVLNLLSSFFSSDVSHVMSKMISDDSAFLFNQRETALPFSASTGYFAL